jgi:hypothetical protein
MARKLSGGISGDPNVSAIQVVAPAVLTAAADIDITVSPSGTGRVVFDTDTQIQAQNDLRFADSDSSNYVGFKAPATVANNLIWTLPATDGSSDQVLTTNASGVLSWSSKSVTLSDQTASATTHYPLFTTGTSGSVTSINVSTTKMTYQPSTGTLGLAGNTASTNRTSGTLIVTGGVGISGALYVGADVVAYASSDIRLKENISKIDSSLEKLMKISGYQYYWNKIAQEMHPERTMLDVGVVAQEVQEVLPSAVVERDDGYLAVNYDKIIPLLIESIKTLKKELDMIKRET